MLKGIKRIDSILGAETQIKGEIKTKGTLRIDGTFEGNIEADCLILTESAHCKGDILARQVIVGGRIEGQVTARVCAEIKPKGHLCGDVITQKLIVSEGGVFEGRSSMFKEDSTVVELSQKK